MSRLHSSEISEQSITVPIDLRYYTSGIPIEQAHTVIIAMHGYGQLAEFFARKFNSITTKAHLVFPEGMHRFYLEGSAGRVGASWMTKEYREKDIEMQERFLSQVYEAVGIQPHQKTVVLGFSQGAATAARWVSANKKRIDHLVIWCGVLPPDMSGVHQLGSGLRITRFIGLEDTYADAMRLAAEDDKWEAVGLQAERVEFQGGHEIRPQELEILMSRIGTYTHSG